ncbi:MAG: sugar phosphate nucleotidyltransferase [Syntrophales bacterium]|nr:sugar phosphate nucleotidyltransferase [Syntrophales bacterium]
MKMIETAFILGAGCGERLRPLTFECPKPLLSVWGRPLISYAMEHLAREGVRRFIVNTHYLAHKYRQIFSDGQWKGIPIVFRYEPVLLGTGGGLKNIEDLLTENDDEIFVYNGDVIADFPLLPLVRNHRKKDREVTLALRSDDKLGNVGLNSRGDIVDIRFALGAEFSKICVFTGICVVSRPFLKRFEPGAWADMVSVMIELLRQEPEKLGAVVIDEGSWWDVGTIESYLALNSKIPF